jgi:hypothetical protein
MREPHDVQKQASTIAHEFFWCSAGRHQACVEELQNTSGAVPDCMWWSLCFEPLVFGLSFFSECVRQRYTAPERGLFIGELETAVRWLLATTLFAPCDAGSPVSQMPPSARTGQSLGSRWDLSPGHERALGPFSRFREERHGRFQQPTNPQTDSDMLFEALKADTARLGFCCPDTVVRVLAEGIVADAYRIRHEVLIDLDPAHLQKEPTLRRARTA